MPLFNDNDIHVSKYSFIEVYIFQKITTQSTRERNSVIMYEFNLCDLVRWIAIRYRLQNK